MSRTLLKGVKMLGRPFRSKAWFPVATQAAIFWISGAMMPGAVGQVQPDFDRTQPVGFYAQVAPTLSKLGCNAGSCHGKSSGQNGFALSLFGFDPASDLEAINKRVDLVDAESSLLLLKSTAQIAHGGGKKLEVGSVDYEALLRWIEQRSQPGPHKIELKLVRLDVRPARQVLPRGSRSGLRVEATWDDGQVVDVTRLSRFESNLAPLVEVNPQGNLTAGTLVGEAAILVRFGSDIAVGRVVVPSGLSPTSMESGADSPIDQLVNRKLSELGLAPSPPCSDHEFARRSSLDIMGLLPRPAEVAAFVSDKRTDKRARWVEALLGRPEYADHFATKWGAILRNRRALGDLSKPSTFAFSSWIREAIAENWPFDRFMAAIVAGRGEVASNPELSWYRQVPRLEERTEDVAQVFLGTRIGCARCHHHPTERWGQDDFAGFAAFFAKVGTKAGSDPTSFRVFHLANGMANNSMTTESSRPRPLGATMGLDLGAHDDPRDALVAWMTGPDNSLFARALVNRYWKHFLGKGLVEPEDDFRATNPATNPELLDALAKDLIANGFDLKQLIRTITTSATYSRSSQSNSTNEADLGNFARYAPKRLSAEALLDAIDEVAGTVGRFEGVPPETRAMQLPDDGFVSPFLDAFGRPHRRTACECERTAEPSLSQALFLLNSTDLETKLASPTGRAARYAGLEDLRSDASKIEELYRVAMARTPSPDELDRALNYIKRHRRANQAASGYADLIWAVINTKEFLYNH